MHYPALILALAASTLTVAAAARTTPPPPQGAPLGHGPGMMRGDADRDGVLTRAEAVADATRRFDRMDTNHDGRLDQAEMDAVRQRRMMRRGGAMTPPPGDPAD